MLADTYSGPGIRLDSEALKEKTLRRPLPSESLHSTGGQIDNTQIK